MAKLFNLFSKNKSTKAILNDNIENLVKRVKSEELTVAQIQPSIDSFYAGISEKLTPKDLSRFSKVYAKYNGDDINDEEIRNMAVDYYALKKLFNVKMSSYVKSSIYTSSFEEKLIGINNKGIIRRKPSMAAIESLALEQNTTKFAIINKYQPVIDELGVSFAMFYQHSLYKMTPSMQKIRARVLLRQKKDKKDSYETISNLTGKSVNDIKNQIKELNKDDLFSINASNYRNLELYNKSDDEIDEIRKKARKARILGRKLRIKLDDVRDGVITFDSIKDEIDEMYELCKVFATDTEAENLKKLYSEAEAENISHEELIRRTVDSIVMARVLNFSAKEYVAFKFENKSFEKRMEYLPENDKVKLMSYMATEEALDILNDKYKTYLSLNEFYNRDIILISSEDDLDAFKDFCSRHNRFVKKALTDSLGNSIELINSKGLDVEKLFFDIFYENGEVLIEECVVSHPSIAKFNPDSVNTVRLVTYLDDGKVLFPCTTMRFGLKGSFVDNAGAGGLSVLIDAKTGTIISDGYGQNGEIYDKHPDSGITFKGYKLPYWEDALNLGRKIADRIPGTVYIGWDLALDENGKWVIIEGNAKPQLFGVQSTYGQGAWSNFYGMYLKHRLNNAHEKVYLMPYSHLQPNKRSESLVYLSGETGIPYEEVYYKAERAFAYHEIPWFTFAQRKLILEDEAELQRVENLRLKKAEILLKEICEEENLSYDYVSEKYEDAYLRYQININDFFANKLFLYSRKELADFMDSKVSYADSVLDKLVTLSGKTKSELKAHMWRCRVKYSIKQNTYTTLQCYKLGDDVLDTYLMGIEQIYLMDKYNDPEYTKYFRSKDLFHEVFYDQMGRDSWTNRNTSFEEFKTFIEGKSVLFGKPDNSYGGKGTSVITVEGDLEELYNRLMAEPYSIYEEYIMQHPVMSAVYSGSLNTVRVVTINDGNDVNVILAFVRFGNGGIVDNLSSGGMCAAVDVSNGRIITKAIDMHDIQYEFHPLSNRKFTDITIPHWDKVLKLVKDAGTRIPQVGFVGWDVAICEDKVLLVEGNDKSTLSGYQVCFADKYIGQRYLVERFL